MTRQVRAGRVTRSLGNQMIMLIFNIYVEMGERTEAPEATKGGIRTGRTDETDDEGYYSGLVWSGHMLYKR